MKKRIPKQIIGFFLIVLFLEGMLAGCSKQEEKEKISLIDYIEAQYAGSKEQLQVTLKLDAEKVKEKYEEIKANESVIDAMIFSVFMSGIELEYDKENNSYKNGDKISVKFHWDEQAAGECKYEPDPEGDFQIRIREDIKEVDPFEGLEVMFSGMNGQGWADFNSYDCHPLVKDEGIFQVVGREEDEDYEYSLKNGDKITVEFMWTDSDRIYTEEKLIMSRKTKEYEVEGLGSYAKIVAPEDVERYNGRMLEFTKKQIQMWKGDNDYSITPYKYYYYYNEKLMSDNAYIGIYKVESEAKGNTFYYMSITFSLYRSATGEVIIDSIESEDGTEMFVMSASGNWEEYVLEEEELSDLETALEKRDLLGPREYYKFMEVK